jgi:DNA-binding response OmpR family regulator
VKTHWKGRPLLRHRPLPAEAPKILCVDDDPYLTDLLHYALERDGYQVAVAGDGATALHLVQRDSPDLVLLDVHLPDTHGLTLCGELRRLGRMPVILLTAGDTETDVITGFQHGADDYVAKPFNMQILSYRIQAVLRRSRGRHNLAGPRTTRYALGPGAFDAEQHEVIRGDTRIRLTPLQGKLLRLLLENEGRVISSEQIMTNIWHYDTENDISVVKTHICNLRKRLAGVLGTEDLIRTVTGLGYMFRLPS